MTEIPPGEGPGPENQFRELQDRPTPEIDSPRLWERIETRLTPRAVPLWRRLLGLGGASAAAGAVGAPRLAYGLATLAVLVAVWLTWTLISGGGESMTQVVDSPAAVQQEVGTGEAGSARLVLLTPEEVVPEGGSDAAVSAAVEGSMRVRFRLVRGYDGTIPADVSAATALGVGGADALNDVRDQLDLLDEHDELGIVGSWEGEVAAGQTLNAELSDVHRIIAGAVEVTESPRGALRLRNVAVEGTDQPLVATDLSLIPGRTYILGVVPADGTNPSVFLVVDVEPAGRQRP